MLVFSSVKYDNILYYYKCYLQYINNFEKLKLETANNITYTLPNKINRITCIPNNVNNNKVQIPIQ